MKIELGVTGYVDQSNALLLAQFDKFVAIYVTANSAVINHRKKGLIDDFK